MQELTNRQLLDRELIRYTVAGWQIVSQSESGFQVVQPHVVSANMVALFVISPNVIGVLASLFSVAFGSVLLSLAFVLAALLALDHLTARPKLLYITADQLRNPLPTTIEHNSRGITVCSMCQRPARTDATVCGNCNARFGSAWELP